MKEEFSIFSRRKRDPTTEVRGRGQNEAFVVIGVFADNVYPARGLRDGLASTEHFVKTCHELG
jgi:hypothetical protein